MTAWIGLAGVFICAVKIAVDSRRLPPPDGWDDDLWWS